MRSSLCFFFLYMMKKTFSNLTLLCLLAAVIGCKNTDQNAAQDFKYNITMTELTEPDWFDLVDSASYIVLKSPDGSAMGEVKQLVVSDDRIYVLADGFYCFDMDGNCVFKQTAKGRARNEFLNPTSISVSDGQLFVYDMTQNKGLFYDAHTGRHITTATFQDYVRAAYCSDDYIICRNSFPEGPDKARYYVYSKNNTDQSVSGFFSENEHELSIRGTDTWSNDEGLFYTSYRRNLAWKIKGKECIPYIRLTVPSDQTIPDRVLDEIIEKGVVSPKAINDNTNYVSGLSFIAENDGFIFGQCGDNHLPIYFLYDKKSGNARFFYRTAESYLWQLLPVYERPSVGRSDCIYTIVGIDNLLYYKSILGSLGVEPSLEKYRQAYDACNSVTENDYAIVACLWFKEL